MKIVIKDIIKDLDGLKTILNISRKDTIKKIKFIYS